MRILLPITVALGLICFQVPIAGQELDFDALAKAMEEQIDGDAISKAVPTTIDDFREIENIASALSGKAVEATVGVRLGDAYASGVIVSEDGYVLTASHVAGAPNRSVDITFSDGRKTRGRTLGLNPDVDGALIKINDSGPWPFIPMAERGKAPESGDWCIALGHPGGYERGRTPPVRLGRVIFANGYLIRSDCPIEPGDSGGPLIDLRGYVIGVHSRIFDDTTGNLHVPIVTFWRTWDELKAGEISQLSPSSSFLAQFDVDQNGKLTLEELPPGDRRDAYERLSTVFSFDVDQPQPMNELREKIGLDISKRPTSAMGRLGQVFFSTTNVDDMLSEFDYTRGMSILNVMRDITSDASKATVNVLVNGEDRAHGGIVDPDGWIVTKASEIETADPSDRINCQLYDSRRFRAKLVHVDQQYDLAWLRIGASDLPALKWADGGAPAVGRWVVSTSRGRTPLSVGVISVGGREIQSTPGFMGVGGSPARTDAYVQNIIKGSGASGSDLQIGDTIVAVNDVIVHNFAELKAQVERYLAGDVLRLKVIRDGSDQYVTVQLGHRLDADSDPDMTGRLSLRRNGFPFAFRHDTVLQPEECGGPVVDLQGNAVGINIARKQRTGSLALSSETIQRLLLVAKQEFEKLKGQP